MDKGRSAVGIFPENSSDPTATADFENTIISLLTSGTAVGTPTQNAGTK